MYSEAYEERIKSIPLQSCPIMLIEINEAVIHQSETNTNTENSLDAARRNECIGV